MSHRNARFVLAGVIASVAVALLSASTPVFWQVATRADLLKGDVENLSIDNDGRLTLGPPTAMIHDSAAPFLWAAIPGSDGALIVGSGNEGKVFRVDKEGKATTLYDAPELEVHALAPAPNGAVYVAASPDGQIYRVDAKGTATPFFKPEEKYIWSLAVDSSGNVFAGTGEKGAIYKITPDGKGSVFYKTRSTNVVALAIDKAGNLLAGTESPGRVFRIDREGQAFVLLESGFREIHSLRVNEAGVIYATAVAAKTGSGDASAVDLPTAEPSRPAVVPSVSTEITGVTIIDVGGATTTEAKPGTTKIGPRGTKGAVYRIQPDGLWDTIWESNDDTPYDVAFDAGGGVLIGTGGKGKIFRVAGDPPQVTLVGRAPAQQVTQFLPMSKGETLYLTANPGKIFRLSPGRSEKGTYESDVRDAQTVSSWGTISWKATAPPGARIEMRTRSGNSQTPDDTWSKWSEPYRNPEGQQIDSPKARYLQWQATLLGKDASPVLTSVTAAYLQRNLRPVVGTITVYPAGNVFQKPYSTGEGEIAGFEDGWPDTRPSPNVLAAAGSGVSAASLGASSALGRRIFQKGLQTFTWKGEDDNEDKLIYDVLYRRENETSWKTLRRGLTDQLFVWDTTSVPNGTYVLRIVASDAPSNPPGAALTGEADSTTFDVDNTPPAVHVTAIRREGGRTVITFDVADEDSAVQRMDYSLDATRWRPIYPKDGICDSRTEQFELSLEGDAVGVVLRGTDAMGNVATARADVVPKSEKK
jgi:sugar lactone lactonase YvrE